MADSARDEAASAWLSLGSLNSWQNTSDVPFPPVLAQAHENVRFDIAVEIVILGTSVLSCLLCKFLLPVIR